MSDEAKRQDGGATPRIPVVVIRHPKERISKCSLRHLHERPEISFFKATKTFSFDATDHLLLAVDAPPLSPADAGHPLLLLDSTWRLLPTLQSCLRGTPIRRSIPDDLATTCYPRASKNFEDPTRGLASVEALYLAKRLLGEDDPTLLDGYHWQREFLAQFEAH
jgi:pre-rRNA-processing protein TSR3